MKRERWIRRRSALSGAGAISAEFKGALNNFEGKLMTTIKSILNNTLNKIHDWGEPQCHPMKRMFLTRITSVACIALEASGLAWTTVRIATLSVQEARILSAKGVCKIVPPMKKLLKSASKKSLALPIKEAYLDICRLTAGLASTILVGALFSPELNFRLHIKLRLAVDNLALKKQRELDAKVRIETKAAEITKARAERFALFELERKAAENAKAKEDAIDAHLAELLYPPLSQRT